MRGLFGFGLVRISGRSMAPTLQPGDYVLVRRYGRFRRPRRDDVIVYAPGSGQKYIKRLIDIQDDGRFIVRGDGVQSAPSIDLGPVDPASVQGRVVHVIRGRQVVSQRPNALS